VVPFDAAALEPDAPLGNSAYTALCTVASLSPGRRLLHCHSLGEATQS